MGKLIFSINITVDGCCDHRAVIADDELHTHATRLLDDAEAVLFGRTTYDLFEAHWPRVAANGKGSTAEVNFARRIDEIPKYVISHSRKKSKWHNSIFLNGDLFSEVKALKENSGNILILGSVALAGELARVRLINELRLFIQPIVAGHGPRLFGGLSQSNLKLTDSTTLASGVIAARHLW